MSGIRLNNQDKVMLSLPVILIIVFIGLLFVNCNNREQNYIQRTEIKDAEIIANSLKYIVNQQIKEVKSLNSYLIKQQPLSQNAFNSLSERLFNQYPYIHNIEWGVEIDHDERSTFEKAMQERYQQPIVVTAPESEGGLIRSPNKKIYMPIQFVYPYQGNNKALGFDPSQGKGLLNNLLQAKLTQQVTISSAVRLAQAEQWPVNRASNKVMMYFPIIDTQNIKPFLGYLSITIDIDELVRLTVPEPLFDSLKIKLIDVTEKAKSMLFELPEAINQNAIYVSQRIQIANRVWSVEVSRQQVHDPKIDNWSSNNILLLGAVATLLLIIIQRRLYLFVLNTRKEQALSEISKNEIDSYEELLAVTFETHQAILITDVNSKILRVNKAFCEITGYMEQDVIGEDPKILSSGRQSAEFYDYMWSQILAVGRYEGEIWNRRKNGEIYPEYQTITAIKNSENKTTHYVSVFSDITVQKQQEEKAKHIAFYDPLTLLPNRKLLVDRIEKELTFSRRFDKLGVIISIDIDHFEQVNKQYGHQYGDELLIVFSERLKSDLRETDTIARINSNHFIVMLPAEKVDVETLKSQVNVILTKLSYHLNDTYDVYGAELDITVSFGVTIFDKHSLKVSDILRKNDLALFQAKSMSERGSVFFDSDDLTS